MNKLLITIKKNFLTRGLYNIKDKLASIFNRKILIDYLLSFEKSNLINHSKNELELVGVFDKDSDYNGELGNSILNLVRYFSMERHSGFSANYSINILQELLKYKILSPLTGEDSEWVEVGDNFYQNKRLSTVFKDNNKCYDIDGYYFVDKNGMSYTNRYSCKYISFPYYPQPPIRVEEGSMLYYWLTKDKNK